MKTREPAWLRGLPLGLSLGSLVTLAGCLVADGEMHSPFGWIACGVTAATVLRWGVPAGAAAALGAAAVMLMADVMPPQIAWTSSGAALAGSVVLRHLAVTLGVHRDLGRCGDVARLFAAVSLAMTVPAALTLLFFAGTGLRPTAGWAGLQGLKWSLQAMVATLALLPPLLAFDSGTLARWRRQPLDVLGLLLATTAIAAITLLRVPELRWVVLLGLPVVAAAVIRVDLAFAGVLGLLCTGALVLGVEWSTGADELALATRVSGLLWSYSVLISGLMLTVHALCAERTAVEAEIAAESARHRIGMLSAAVHEQERIGRALHDGLGVELGQLARTLESLDQAMAGSSPEARNDVVEMRAACRRAVEAAEAVAYGLMPPIERDGDLARALRELAGRVPASAGLDVALQIPERPGLSVAASRDIYRIVQEALNNVLKHSAAHTLRIALVPDAGGGVELLVEDDGVGLGAAARAGEAGAQAGAAGVGLGTMRYRAERAGGVLRVEPRVGGGTRVIARLPCATGAAAQAPDPIASHSPVRSVTPGSLGLRPDRGAP